MNIDAFLRAVSFAPGGRPEYDSIRELFRPGGQLIRAIGDTVEVMTVDEFITPRQAQFESGALTEFEEVELAAISEEFGNVAHRFSTYRKRGVLNGEAFEALGAITTQFVGGQISVMAWDDERPGLTLGERYRV